MISIGYYNGKTNTSPYCGPTVKTIVEAQIWLKNNLEFLEKNSYGVSIWETNSWDRGPGQRAGKPKVYLSWHRDGSDCYGQLFNPDTGWRFTVGSDNKIHEDFVR